jgi:hypothetical protein
VLPFDLDGDGVTEIWCVDTADDEWHFDEDDPGYPVTNEQLVRIDPRTGNDTGSWEWPWRPPRGPGFAYRYFIMGGHVGDEPVLLTAQGTYDEMEIQAWNAPTDNRWTHHIPADAAGAYGSHRTPVLDIDGDGSDELLWGERLIDIDTGTEIWCADRDRWEGHSDLVQAMYHHAEDEWFVYTIRETETEVSPRVVMYDSDGNRVWHALESGHVHWGWTGHFETFETRYAMASTVEKEEKITEDFGWEAFTGDPIEWDYRVDNTVPVDIDGDGCHEIVYKDGGPGPEVPGGKIIDYRGEEIGSADTHLERTQPSKLLDHPGEHIPSHTPDGIVRIWGDRNAEDSPEAKARFEHPYYDKAQRLSAVGYNWELVAGL